MSKELLVRSGSLLVAALVVAGCVSGGETDRVVAEVDADMVEEGELDGVSDAPEEVEEPDAPAGAGNLGSEEADDTGDLDALRASFECPAVSDRMLLASVGAHPAGGFVAARDVLDGGFENTLEVGPFSTFEEPVAFMVVEDMLGYYEANGPDTIDTLFATATEQGSSGASDAVFIRSVYQAGDDVAAAVEFRDGRPSTDRDVSQIDVADDILAAAGDLGWLVVNEPSVGVTESGEVIEADGSVTEFAHSGALEVWWGCWKLVVQIFGPDEALVAEAVSVEMQDWVAALTVEISS